MDSSILEKITPVDFVKHIPKPEFPFQLTNFKLFSFNLTFCPIRTYASVCSRKETFLYAVRVIKVYKDDVVPGNDFRMIMAHKISGPGPTMDDVGKNFMWNRWTDPDAGSDSTILFIGNHETGEMRYIETDHGLDDPRIFVATDDIVVKRKNTFVKIVSKNDIVIHSSDCKHINKISMVRGAVSTCEIEIFKRYRPDGHIKNCQFFFHKKRAFLVDWLRNDGLSFVCPIVDPKILLYSFRDYFVYTICFKNMSYCVPGKGSAMHVEYCKKSNQLRTRKSAQVTIGYCDSRSKCDECRKIKLNMGLGNDLTDDRICENCRKCSVCYAPFHNYGISPGFSFGSPLIPVEFNGRQLMLGVGHSKISNTGYYVKKSKIWSFRKRAHRLFRKAFGNKYKKHFGSNYVAQGYMYLIYFFLLDYTTAAEKILSSEELEYGDPEKHGYKYIPRIMTISDSILPVDLVSWKKTRKYMFSLFFPMGIVRSGNSLLVSCGEGDFYSLIFRFNFQKVLESCVHDVLDLDMKNYNYHMISYFGENDTKMGFKTEYT
ncbi:MAG: hypothetical protein Satyrvirus22_16 [Satyrvirus sp.]|uniref:Uncharacterized protein n=1 Tax=Satyrvirus sp. TaxID=2487771 RepID=A0A3G5AED7_9VIRU|nr:MAG: hypothetical protein Satyrvirus22_16 [Satyrvirus sp.]